MSTLCLKCSNDRAQLELNPEYFLNQDVLGHSELWTMGKARGLHDCARNVSSMWLLKWKKPKQASVWILTSSEGSGMSAGPWPPACPSAAGLKVMSACGWLFWPGCWGGRGWRGGWEDGGPLWCNGWADWLLGWGDACMPGCMEAWDWSALTGRGICRGRRQERWVYLHKVDHWLREQP